VAEMLSIDPRRRPSVNRLLTRPVIRGRIQHLLSSAVLRDELSHTVGVSVVRRLASAVLMCVYLGVAGTAWAART
jgi:hypothetical protein